MKQHLPEHHWGVLGEVVSFDFNMIIEKCHTNQSNEGKEGEVGKKGRVQKRWKEKQKCKSRQTMQNWQKNFNKN